MTKYKAAHYSETISITLVEFRKIKLYIQHSFRCGTIPNFGLFECVTGSLCGKTTHCSYFTAQNSPPVEFQFKIQLSILVKDWLFFTNTGKVKEKLFIETKHAI